MLPLLLILLFNPTRFPFYIQTLLRAIHPFSEGSVALHNTRAAHSNHQNHSLHLVESGHLKEMLHDASSLRQKRCRLLARPGLVWPRLSIP